MMYRYAWRNNAKRRGMFGRPCRIVAAGRLNNVEIEFADNGQREVVSRRALRGVQETTGEETRE